jgi:rsbT co-antagonist protein RsbR
VAQALVRLGVDTSPMHTECDLRSGLEEAERLLGYKVVKIDALPAGMR